jgi:sterol 24-C-methyltransferase
LHYKESVDKCNKEYKTLVNSYYDLATVFYKVGWGQCFHFAYRYFFESFAESLRRHEYYLASKLMLTEGLKVLDVGCGVGGPMRNISRFTGNDVTGVTLNPYQVQRGNELCQQAGLADQCRSIQGDFMHMPFEAEEFDAAYAIEATCHAPDRVGVYKEIFRVLKPGTVFACYEWCMTDKFDPDNKKHLKIKKQIEEGAGLPDICHTSVCLNAMKEAGFEILEERDMAEDKLWETTGGRSWMLPLLPSWNPCTQRFQFNWLGRELTNGAVYLLELIRLAPTGTVKTQKMLQQGAFGLGDGGKFRIFTPMYLMVGRVPADTAGPKAGRVEQ